MIPPEAIEAAHEQLDAMGSYVPRKYIEAALEAAAPYMLAAAWLEGHEAGRDYQGSGWNADGHDPNDDNPHRNGDVQHT